MTDQGKDFLLKAGGLANTARALACAGRSRLWVPAGYFEPSEHGDGPCAVIEPMCSARGTERARIDLSLIAGAAFRKTLVDLLIREIEPFVIGIGEVRAVWDEASEEIVISRQGSTNSLPPTG